MLHEIGNHEFHNEFINKEISENDLYIKVVNRKLLVKKDGDTYTLPSVKQFGKLESTYLFKIDDIGFYMCDSDFEGFDDYVSASELRYYKEGWLRYGMLEGIALSGWYQNNQYCGRCGKKLIKDDKERMLKCQCGNMIYPRINPVAIVGIIKDNTMLLTKYADSKRFARYALVAGFCEFGESLEQTVIREVKEETSLNIKNIKYFGSQPWPLSDSLIFGLFCELDGQDNIAFNDNELAVAKWLKPEEMPIEEESASITYRMMDEFRLKGRDVLK